VCGQREPLLYVNDMVEAAERIVAVCAGIPAEQLLDDVDRADIVLWRLTVLGEAAKSVSPRFAPSTPRWRGATPHASATASSITTRVWIPTG
jgi:uncharacterized protein with HEPN domain